MFCQFCQSKVKETEWKWNKKVKLKYANVIVLSHFL